MAKIAPTITLYDDDAYAVSFDALVVSARAVPVEEIRGQAAKRLTPNEQKAKETAVYYEIVLDRTLFFPEQGGQVSDIGTLRPIGSDCAVTVIDAQINDGIITHTVCCEPAQPTNDTAGDDAVMTVLLAGTGVHGEVDFTHRFDFMQNHSGEHILSGTAHRLYGCDNVGFHLTENEMTLDFSKLLSPEEVAALEREANAAVYADKEIVIAYPSEEAAASIDYRSKKEIAGRLRIVTIEGVDVCACCAPHVHRTGEIGFIKVVKIMKNKGGTRLKVVCGWRAYEFLTSEYRLLHEASDMLSTSTENVPERIKRFKDEIYALKGEIKGLKAELQKT